MPTPKQVRYHYKKCSVLFDKLADALNEAHNKKVLEYEQEKYDTNSPCPLVYEAITRFNSCCRSSLYYAYKSEILHPRKPKKRKTRKPKLASVTNINGN